MNQVVMINNNSIEDLRSLFSLAVNKICLSEKGSGRGSPFSTPHPSYLHILYPALNVTVGKKSYTQVYCGM